MRNNMTVRSALAAVAFVFVSGVVLAQPSADYRTFFTFSGPIAIPGVTLPAGKYLFQLADTPTRNVAQVLSADGKTPYAAFYFHRVQRRDPARDPEIRFMETAVDMPRAVRTWWYPGDRTGYEFVYPKQQALLLAKGIGKPVLATESTAPGQVTPPLETVMPTGEQRQYIAESTFAPTTGPTLIGEIAPAEPVAVQQRAELPRTASATPIVVFAGLLLLFGAGFLRAWRETL